jgi:hypothetical protein
LEKEVEKRVHVVVMSEEEKVWTGVKVEASLGLVMTPTMGAGW